jgi:hypothetical protein
MAASRTSRRRERRLVVTGPLEMGRGPREATPLASDFVTAGCTGRRWMRHRASVLAL